MHKIQPTLDYSYVKKDAIRSLLFLAVAFVSIGILWVVGQQTGVLAQFGETLLNLAGL